MSKNRANYDKMKKNMVYCSCKCAESRASSQTESLCSSEACGQQLLYVTVFFLSPEGGARDLLQHGGHCCTLIAQG